MMLRGDNKIKEAKATKGAKCSGVQVAGWLEGPGAFQASTCQQVGMSGNHK